jgi:hypothetical protein
MRLPSWGEFVEKEKIWEKHIQQKINEKISDRPRGTQQKNVQTKDPKARKVNVLFLH